MATQIFSLKGSGNTPQIIAPQRGDKIVFDFPLAGCTVDSHYGLLRVTAPDGSVFVFQAIKGVAFSIELADGTLFPSFEEFLYGLRNLGDIDTLISLPEFIADFEMSKNLHGASELLSSGTGLYRHDAGELLPSVRRLGALPAGHWERDSAEDIRQAEVYKSLAHQPDSGTSATPP